MKRELAALVELLALERLGPDLYRGVSEDTGWGVIFGGQVLGQALSAAAQTVAPDRAVHSLHGYFKRVGDVTRPILYQVERGRDGRLFTTRRVVAAQEGAAIFSLEASFHVHEEGFEHQDPMPSVPAPETLQSDQDLALAMAESLPGELRARATTLRAIETRGVEPRDPFHPAVNPPRRHLWLRAIDGLPDDPALHGYLLAYASDFSFLPTALDPHGVGPFTPGVHVASLDHAMWFHRPFRFDDWLLYVMDSPSASGARALVHGRFFDRGGRLVASTAQEGLVRRHG
jgi:acyl-CoA thioesterase-2